MQVNQSNYQRPMNLLENESQQEAPKTQAGDDLSQTTKVVGQKTALKKTKNQEKSESPEDFVAALAAFQAQIQPEAKLLASGHTQTGTQTSTQVGAQMSASDAQEVAPVIKDSASVVKNIVPNSDAKLAALENAKINSVINGKSMSGSEMKAKQPGVGIENTKVALNGSVMERIPQTMLTATSMKTAGAVAGLKPWSTEWVRQGENPMDFNEGSEVKPLFGDAKGIQRGAASSVALEKMIGELTGQIERDFGKAKLVAAPGQEGLTEMSIAASQLPSIEATAPNSKPRLVTGREFLDVQAAAKPSEVSSVGNAVVGAPIVPVMLAKDNQNNKDKGNFSQMPEKLGEKLGTKSKGPLSKEELGVTKSSLAEVMAQNPQIYKGELAAMNQPESRVVVAPLTGQVVKGAMSQDRLSRESLLNIGTGIQKLQIQGGGEIKMRLRPDNLGELVIKVSTHGHDVGLQIQASNESAKQVIEDSMVHLRESLSNQNLQLHNVETTLIPKQSAEGQFSQSSNDSSFNSQQWGPTSDLLGQSNQRQAQQGWDTESNQAQGNRNQSKAVQSFSNGGAAQARGLRESGNSRLDVVA